MLSRTASAGSSFAGDGLQSAKTHEAHHAGDVDGVVHGRARAVVVGDEFRDAAAEVERLHLTGRAVSIAIAISAGRSMNLVHDRRRAVEERDLAQPRADGVHVKGHPVANGTEFSFSCTPGSVFALLGMDACCTRCAEVSVRAKPGSSNSLNDAIRSGIPVYLVGASAS